MTVINLRTVEQTMERLLEAEPCAIVYRDHATGLDLAVSPASTASASGLLPVLVVAGEAVWREATGKGFALDIVKDQEALLGYRLRGIGAGNFTTVVLAAMEAAAQVARPGVIVINDLNALWTAATDRLERSASHVPRTASGIAP
jgi:hypothetical protein